MRIEQLRIGDVRLGVNPCLCSYLVLDPTWDWAGDGRCLALKLCVPEDPCAFELVSASGLCWPSLSYLTGPGFVRVPR